jgi:hypothetical protein
MSKDTIAGNLTLGVGESDTLEGVIFIVQG